MPDACSNCHLTATRYIGPSQECDACDKYRKRHEGKPRPVKLVARAGENRYSRVDRDLELVWLRANGFHSYSKDDPRLPDYVDYPDGSNREVINP